jgi:putative ABC transport system substrate-binding protein
MGASALTMPRQGSAQPRERVPLVGILNAYPQADSFGRAVNMAFIQGMQALGWSERTFQVENRWSNGTFDEMQQFAKELVALRPHVIFAPTGAPGVTALLHETRMIPIVFTTASDPVGLGFVESLERPGGNVTGFSLYESSLGSKWVEALKRISPAVRRIALIFNRQTSVHPCTCRRLRLLLRHSRWS